VRVLALLLALAVPASAQEFTYRGFAEIRPAVYPQATPQDDNRFVVEGRARFDPALRPVEWLTLSGSVEARADNVHQVAREWDLNVRDRALLRPALSLRQGSAAVRRGTVVADFGKQFIRWGKTDILNPTDRFAPRDFLEVTDDEFLAVTGARLQYARGPQSFDVVWVPFFTPSRIPLSGRRWSPPPPETIAAAPIVPVAAVFPERSQYGLRWNLLGSGFDFSTSYFDGLNHLPDFTVTPLANQAVLALQPTYAPLRMVGADAAVPLRWLTVKGEMATLFTTSDQADDLVLYVIQVERQSGELSLVAGYAGEIVIERRSLFDFAPDRGLTRAFLGRAGYTISAARDAAVEMALRQNLDGVWIEGHYSQAHGAHWRMTIAAIVIAGDERDFIGQYSRNSHLLVTLRYSF
jgi:hypothetical protein